MFRRGLVLALALCSSTALADEAAARKDFEAGERAYNLGDFNKAAELFKQAYDEWPKPEFLFNLAQTYRQAGDCKQALFFYKRFLSLKQSDTKKPIKPELKTEVEKRIVELEECTRRELANKPPDQLDNGNGSATSTTTTGTTGATNASTTTNPTTGKPSGGTASTDGDGEQTDEDEKETPTPAPTAAPTLVTARLLAGAGKLGASALETKVQFAGALEGAYPLALAPQFQLELGAAFAFMPIPYTTTMNESGSGGMIDLLANVAARYTVIPNLSLRPEVGAGVMLFTGLGKMGNPFTEGGNPASGALTSFAVRGAASVDYAVTPNVLVSATPFAFAYSPAPAGFKSEIPSLTIMSFMVGVGYQK